jgi:hypothetical protein
VSLTKLQLYNDALLLCEQGPLSSLTEALEARRLLDAAFDSQAYDKCLSRAQWNFAIRTVMLDYSPSVEPEFGYRRAFDKPTDCIRLVGISADEYFNIPLTRYKDEAAFWFADEDILYVSYVSNDASYGGDIANWSAAFGDYVAAFLAEKIVGKLTNKESVVRKVERAAILALREAKTLDAMDEAPGFAPQGSWTRARRGGGGGDRGGRGSLIG